MHAAVWLAFALLFSAQVPATSAPWAALSFLFGEWTGEGGGEPGRGAGTFSFQPDLDAKIVVRKNRSEYPATAARAAFRHDDLMVIYREPGSGGTRAIYFDNEGHVIHYSVRVGGGGNSAEFLSDPAAGASAFRLTYTRTGAGVVAIKFEIAPADKPSSFTTYLEGRARRARE